MKIAFTSCFDAEDDPVQVVWDRIAEQRPDVLLLLGDSIYMDFGIKLLGADRPLGRPRKFPLEKFAAVMHGLYARQWGVASFQRLVRGGVRLGMTWDDHDFAWNNSRGAGQQDDFTVPQEKRRIARGLFLQFRHALETLASGSPYPACPSLPELLAQPDAGIQSLFDVGEVRFIMLDGRSFRQDPSHTDPPISSMHGASQMAWLIDQLKAWPGIKVVGAGSVMSGADEAWEAYLDYARMLDEAPSRVIVLTGDIHHNRRPRDRRPLGAHLYEITASGAARPGPFDRNPRFLGASGNFGLLVVEHGQVEASLFEAGGHSGTWSLDF